MRYPNLSRRFVLGAGAVAGLKWARHRAHAAQPLKSDPAIAGVIRYQGWAGTVLFPELAEALGYMAPLRLQWVGNVSSGPQDLQAAITGNTEFASAFNGAIMKMVGVGAPFKAVFSYEGTNDKECSGLLVRDHSPIHTARDLIGRSIGMNTLRGSSECFVDQYLQVKGLSKEERDQITIVAVPSSLGEAALRHGRVDALVASTFFRDETLSCGGIREIVRDVDLYGICNEDSVILRNSYMQEYPQEAAHFVQASTRAIVWCQQAPVAEVVKLMTSIIHQRRRGESTLPVHYWSACSVATRGGVLSGEDFKRFQPWYAARGDMATASLSPSIVFTNRLNPYHL
ncbi:ABC transporter substrate-binding protein [Saccharibacter sp. 17.LH.SD]|uniref:ABC transporter substrate-binding protein n=1 Tax=Saccharibacter sp. 17.LH.SD TaxID=2689393 RepID=UPI00136A0689|nr:ABC transporter substrate-binding protein [Saccharibacter sp. 17.LH.SD]MXV44690.1 ABC transporter substrate-binding protein [Saccharibacter sp. 17.LH.SD]